ncbi:MAG: hypothetical protein IT198_14600 [Acidimicrobiia bacterium]|nr:hypothetical protein [Acidimicrobiia bacterium]
MSCTRRPVVIVDVTRTAPPDPAGRITGTWLVRGPRPTFEAEPGTDEILWPAGRAVHTGVTPAGREFRACSPYVRDWVPDAAFAASLDRTLDEHFAAVSP